MCTPTEVLGSAGQSSEQPCVQMSRMVDMVDIAHASHGKIWACWGPAGDAGTSSRRWALEEAAVINNPNLMQVAEDMNQYRSVFATRMGGVFEVHTNVG